MLYLLKLKFKFNIRYNNFHTGKSLKKKINSIVKKLSKKINVKFNIDYLENGDSFLTKPNETIFIAKKIIKKITKINPKFSTTGGTSDAKVYKKFHPA